MCNGILVTTLSEIMQNIKEQLDFHLERDNFLFVQCFDKEQRIPCNLPTYDMLMEKEAEHVKEIHDMTEEMMENYAEVIMLYEEKASESE
ncbi:hypothetical protein KM1_204880 [Entamoeba histolytica HM-3:IMSS]|uniref:Uncharacterized protein n=1 Tax=Entamoeba histolytica HM-3:IMSS TaxID=885315 RepID=M7XC36_ENTHI|nr:hypothetical protein KM1_204880 [Entamoeba histolytica HM-3:IMSS]